MCKCKFPDGFVFKPDGVNELDPCAYELAETHKNVTVQVYRCAKCGHIDISWQRQDDTEDIIYKDIDEE